MHYGLCLVSRTHKKVDVKAFAVHTFWRVQDAGRKLVQTMCFQLSVCVMWAVSDWLLYRLLYTSLEGNDFVTKKGFDLFLEIQLTNFSFQVFLIMAGYIPNGITVSL